MIKYGVKFLHDLNRLGNDYTWVEERNFSRCNHINGRYATHDLNEAFRVRQAIHYLYPGNLYVIEEREAE